MCECRHSAVLWVRQVYVSVGATERDIDAGAPACKLVRITRRKRQCRHCGRTYITNERHDS